MIEEGVAREDAAFILEVVGDSARAVPGGKQDLRLKRGQGQRGRKRHCLEGRNQRHAPEAALGKLCSGYGVVSCRNIGRHVCFLLQGGYAVLMVKVPVRDKDGFQSKAFLFEKVQDGSGIASHVYNQGLLPVVKKVAVCFKNAQRKGSDAHGCSGMEGKRRQMPLPCLIQINGVKCTQKEAGGQTVPKA